MVKKDINVSLIQYDCPDSKTEAVARIVDLVEEAAPKSDLVLLAETPYTPYTTVKNFTPVAETIPGNYSDTLSTLAVKYHTYIASGIVEKEGNDIYNSAILISPEGKIILKQRKISLYVCDLDGGFSSGKEISVVDTELGKIGMLICIDTSIARHLYRMAELQPDIILVPSYGLAKTDYRLTLKIDGMVDECIDEWRMRMQMLAKYCRSHVLRADHCGVEEQQVRVGHSIALKPSGEIIAEASMEPRILQVRIGPEKVF